MVAVPVEVAVAVDSGGDESGGAGWLAALLPSPRSRHATALLTASTAISRLKVRCRMLEIWHGPPPTPIRLAPVALSKLA